MKRKIVILVMMLVLVVTMVACHTDKEPENPDGSVNISFFGWGSAEEQTNYQTLISAFMEKNPDVKVTYSATSSEQYMRTLKNKINNLPDVFYIPDTEYFQWADAGRLLNLDTYITDQEKQTIWPKAMSHYLYDRQNYKLGQGNLYALPKDLGPFSMVMNVDLFNQIVADKNLNLSLPDPNVPMTWQDFIDLNKQLSGTYNNTRVYGVTHYELAAAVYSNNADFISADGKTQTITSKNFVDAVQFIADLDLVHGVMPNADNQASTNGFQRFLTQGAVFSFMGPWDMTGFWQNVQFNYDLVPIPVGPAEGSKSTAWVGSMGIAVSEKTKQKEASVRLAKFLTIEEESQRMAYELGQAVPNIMSLAKNDFLNNVGLEGKKALPENKNMFLSIIEENDYVAGKPRVTYYTYENVWYDSFIDELAQVYRGLKTADQLMSSYASKLQADLDMSNSYLQ